MISKHQPGCACCEPGEPCFLVICALGCNETAVAPFDWAIEEFVGGVWVPHSTGSYTQPCTAVPPPDGVGGLEAGHDYRVTVVPTGILAEHFGPATVEFTFTGVCPVNYQNVNVQLEPLDEGACDCAGCGGIPTPAPTGSGLEIDTGVGVLSLANVGGNVWEACATYSTPSFKWCRTFTRSPGRCFECPDWGTYSVPVLFRITYNCLGGAQIDILFPATEWWWEPDCANRPPEPVPADDCDAVGTLADSQCEGSLIPPWSNDNANVCYNHWRLVGSMACVHLPCIAFGPGAPPIPECPPDFECDSPINEDVFLVAVTAEFELDCEAEDPYAIDVEIDLGPRATTCVCADGSAPGTGHETEDHPLAAIFGTNPVFSISRM